MLGGIGISSVTRVFVQQKMKTIAVLKCVGASSTQVLATYLVQMTGLTLAGCVLGVALAAVALAVRRVPAVNSAWLGEGVRIYQSVDIAVAVATPQGLITPIVRGCEQKPVAAISRDLKELSEKARTRGSS